MIILLRFTQLVRLTLQIDLALVGFRQIVEIERPDSYHLFKRYLDRKPSLGKSSSSKDQLQIQIYCLLPY